MEIKNRILKQGEIKWKECRWFQPEKLKRQSERKKEKLKRSLTENGFSSPLYVWENKGVAYIIDGHHRERAMRELELEGVSIPETLPAVWIAANDINDAKKFVLVFNSHYADMLDTEFFDFVEDLDLDGLIEEMSINGIDLDRLREEIPNENQSIPEGFGEEDSGDSESEGEDEDTSQCPNCGYAL